MRIIPKKTKVAIEFFKGIELVDVAVGLVGLSIAVAFFISNLPYKSWFMLGTVILFVALILPFEDDKAYMTLFFFFRHLARPKVFKTTRAALPTENAAASVRPEPTEAAKDTEGMPEDEEDDWDDEDDWEDSEQTKKKKAKAKAKPKPKPVKPKDSPKASTGKAGTKKKSVPEFDVDAITPFTEIREGLIGYQGLYYAIVIEIPSIEFRFLTETRQNNLIDRILGAILRTVGLNETAALVKIDRPMVYDSYVESENRKIAEMKEAYVNGLLGDSELTDRIAIIYDRIAEIKRINTKDKVYRPYHYLVFFGKDRPTLREQARNAVQSLSTVEMNCHVLDDKELAVFLKYNYTYEFDEREIEKIPPDKYMDWILPQKIEFSTRTIKYDGLVTHTLRVTDYPTMVGNAWGHELFNMPSTRAVMKIKPVDRHKAVRRVDRAIDELRGQEGSTGKTSKLIELSQHIETLSELLVLLQGDNETLFDTNLYITIYDYELTERNRQYERNRARGVKAATDSQSAPPTSIKKQIKRRFAEQGFKTTDLFIQQFDAYASSHISAFDSFGAKSRGIHSGSIAAIFPYVYTALCDPDGFSVGESDGTPVFVNFHLRNRERINSNMVIIGKSGSGKSYATKTLLANMAAEDSKIFILDPENEYAALAANLDGKIIDVGSATQGRLNPFHIITSVADDEEEEQDEEEISNISFNTHLQFLEEFFRQILPGIANDALEYLNNLVIRMYESRGIDATTDLSKLTPGDYPVFDDLYDKILNDFQMATGDYSKANLRVLLNYISKFSTGGRNAALWNGEATISTNENFIIFNFQSLLANKNNTIANAQMLLVLKWLDNEIIKNRDYNLKYGAERKIIVVIDEAHVFIDDKYPIALDFMYQLAKRIRKYNGMQIIITQNIKDFVGTEEIARKSTAIINASQYSFIFPLAPNDMHDLVKLYEKAGAINEAEQDEIINNGRGRAFVVTSPSSRTCIDIVATDEVREMFTM